MLIRRERPADFRLVEELTREAFFNLYAPGCAEHLLIHRLRGAACFLPELSLVAQRGEQLVGHIAYSRSRLRKLDGQEVDTLTFGPVSVVPALQGQGIGSALIRHSLEAARELGHRAVIILGDPAYYKRFGFVPAEALGIGTADRIYLSSLQALELVPGALHALQGATFHEDPVFDMEQEDIEGFDAGFPPRQKGWAPTQARFQELVNSGRPMPAG